MGCPRCSANGGSLSQAALHFWWEGLAILGDIFFSCRSSFLIVVLSFLAFCVLRFLTPKFAHLRASIAEQADITDRAKWQ